MKLSVILGGIVFSIYLTAAANAENFYSTNLTGNLGLNVVPSARMYKEGTVSAGVSTLDPYLHSFIGFQITEPLYVSLRQSAEVSNLNDDADRLYPGVDFKLRVLKEGRYRPEVALGVQSAFGHKRMSGEFLALSKRFENVDLTAGLGWGRYGTAAHFDNPFKALHRHFGKQRFIRW